MSKTNGTVDGILVSEHELEGLAPNRPTLALKVGVSFLLMCATPPGLWGAPPGLACRPTPARMCSLSMASSATEGALALSSRNKPAFVSSPSGFTLWMEDG